MANQSRASLSVSERERRDMPVSVGALAEGQFRRCEMAVEKMVERQTFPRLRLYPIGMCGGDHASVGLGLFSRTIRVLRAAMLGCDGRIESERLASL